MRAGNALSFNFGGEILLHKPDKFNALGASDSWNARLDTYYGSELVSCTLRRQVTLSKLWTEQSSKSKDDGADLAQQ